MVLLFCPSVRLSLSNLSRTGVAAKPLQMETWLLLTAYKNSSSSCRRFFTTYCSATILHD